MLGSLLLYFAGEGDWLFASCVFVLGNVGFAAGNVFYESMLPHVARPEESAAFLRNVPIDAQ